MANVLVEEQYLQDIADSIRSKNGTNDTYTPAQMSGAIDNISSSGGSGQILSGQMLLGNYAHLSFLSNSWTKISQTVGSSVNSVSNSDWYQVICDIQKNKLYICQSYYSDTDSPIFIVVDSNNKVISTPYQEIGGHSGYQRMLLNTSGLNDTNGLKLQVGYGHKTKGTYVLDQMVPPNNKIGIYVREIILPTNISGLGDI